MKLIDKIKKFWTETLGPDYESEELAELKIEDPIVQTLQESSKNIDEKVANYGSSSKAQRREILKNVKVKGNGNELKQKTGKQREDNQQQRSKDEGKGERTR